MVTIQRRNMKHHHMTLAKAFQFTGWKHKEEVAPDLSMRILLKGQRSSATTLLNFLSTMTRYLV